MRSVIVTGASRGLGLGMVRVLAAAGYQVIGVARRESTELSELTGAGAPARVHFKPFDLSDGAAIPAFVKGLRREFGSFYGLVNNAGIGTGGLLASMQDAQIETLVRLNTIAPLLLTKYVVRSMMADGGGRIVNVSSIVTFTGFTGLAVYSATKASLVGFTRSLAREVGKLGITVNAVAPGFVDTEMTEGLVGEQRARIIRRSALGRLVTVEDIAHAVEFLLSERATNITGTVLTVDAGATA
ncbi:MAG TPA: SDR family NAD(P)-dependent oxidoreductase [Steroidobacteraceae bacterium]|jgi:3-oxoacyl-[acyl-carrier protein] reductase